MRGRRRDWYSLDWRSLVNVYSHHLTFTWGTFGLGQLHQGFKDEEFGVIVFNVNIEPPFVQHTQRVITLKCRVFQFRKQT